MSFSVTVLGSNSAIPAHGRHPSAQVLSIHDKLYLIDCGEGTQMRFNELGIRWMKINQIFITHLHGDHYFGLIGVLSTYHLLKRSRPLHIYGPAGLRELIEMQLLAGQTVLCYELHFHILEPDKPAVIYQNADLSVETIPLKHRIACTGFLFREKQGDRKIIKEKIDEFGVPVEQIPFLKKGADFVREPGSEPIANTELTRDPLRARSFAYCCDTAFNEEMFGQIRGVDLLYHDCTFDSNSTQRAADTYHSTTLQAAGTAKAAGAKQLLIGHFSSKYEDLYALLDEAKTVFPNALLALEGRTITIER